MENRTEKRSSTGVVLVGFLSGAICGVIAAVLIAPRSGKETRRSIVKLAQEVEEGVLAKADAVRGGLHARMESGKQAFAKSTAVFIEAFEAGKDAFQKEKSLRSTRPPTAVHPGDTPNA
ncbi:MAG: YtxH domain-containing protein [Nitrospira sp.]|nr:YtxH domain-containing protein [Nitrospira sp.]